MKFVYVFGIIIKISSSLPIALSALLGFLAAGSRIIPHPGNMTLEFSIFLGVFFLAAGCSALNQFQERADDQEMARTRNRPLPARKVSPAFVFHSALAMICFGLLLLMVFQSAVITLIGIVGLLIYNFGYTPLKSRTPFAIFFGAIAGCLPPLMGWIAGGGEIFSYSLWIGLGFAYFWQIAHFGLLLIAYSGDYEISAKSNLYKYLGKSGVVLTTLVSMFFCFFAAIQAGGNIPELIRFWIQWVQFAIIMFFLATTISSLNNYGRRFFRLWNSWLGIGILLALAAW
ncbi:MAG: UbiA family prenyltransferase [Candidatus Riflebacteria bacterium]|nr:UbiA family prenyltransferase [Candidatus Riflebacteria bacterium]